MKKKLKLAITTVKTTTFEHMYEELQDKGGDRKLYRIAQEREKGARDFEQVKCIKD